MTPAVFAHGDLRLYLLSLLAEHPRHGYDLIRETGERFGGTYTPSAGTIYPRLSRLEAEGLVTTTKRGRTRVYAITDAGRSELAARADELAQIEQQVTDSVRRLADEVRAGVDAAMRSLRADLASAARERPRGADADAGAAAGPAPGGARAGAAYGPGAAATGHGASAAAGPAASDRAAPDTRGATAPGTAGAAASAASARARTRESLQEADALLTAFRQDVRTELRERAAAGPLPDGLTRMLRDGLAELHRRIRDLTG